MLLSFRSAACRRAGLVGALAFGTQAITGCYARQSIAVAAAPVGALVVVQLTDQARVDLRGTLGTQPEFVEGRVLTVNDSALTLAVRSVESLRGESARWSGESVTLRRAAIATAQAKQLSRSRTALLAAAFVAAVAAAVLTISLSNHDSGTGGSSSGGTPPPNGT